MLSACGVHAECMLIAAAVRLSLRDLKMAETECI